MSDQNEITEAEAEALIDQIRNAEPALTDQQVQFIEDTFRDIGVTRRIATASLRLPGSDLIDGVTGDRETALAFAQAANNAELHIGQMRAAADLIETFMTRVQVALCLREDYADILAQTVEVEAS